MSTDPKHTRTDFQAAVNMTATQLKKWLNTAESKEVGAKSGAAKESVGHHMGHEIIDLIGKKSAEMTDDDHKQMAKVVGYIRRHSAQRPDGDIKETPWRYSLMNWGHDPLKEK